MLSALSQAKILAITKIIFLFVSVYTSNAKIVKTKNTPSQGKPARG
jgi:hypothetical protein